MAPCGKLAGIRNAVTSMADSARSASSPAQAASPIQVRRADLPLSCPLPSMAVWNEHPRVYLAIENEGGHSQCPYCGTRYVLVD